MTRIIILERKKDQKILRSKFIITSRLLPETGRSQSNEPWNMKRTKLIEIHQSRITNNDLLNSASKHVFPLRWLTEQKKPKFLRSWQNAQRDTTNFAIIIRGLQMWFSYVNTVGPNHPYNIACVLNLRVSLDFCYLLSKLARRATINDRKLFWIFLV